MSKSSLFKFLVQPGEVVRGVRRLGGKGAVLHGMRRTGAAMERALLGPAQLRINPMGAVCNHTCPMCWLQHLEPDFKKQLFKEDREQGMNLAEYEAMLDSMPAGLTEVNVVGGGEPLVHKECVGIMRAVKRRGIQGYLITNGTLLDEDVARALVDMRWDLTRISTHGGDAHTYELVQGVNHFEKLKKNLQTFDRLRREAGLRETCALHVHHVLQRENIDTVPLLFQFAEDVGADRVIFELIFALSDDKRLNPEELERTAAALEQVARTAQVPSNAEKIAASMRQERDQLRAEAQARQAAAAPAPAAANGHGEPPHPHVAVPDAPYKPANRCSVGFDSAFVTSRGDVMPCCFSDEVMGNVREASFRDIWYGERYVDFRKRLINGQFSDYCIKVRCKLTSFLHD